MIVKSKRTYLKPLEIRDITKDYIKWINDPEVNKFLSTKESYQTVSSIQKYVSSYKKRTDKILFGIFIKENGKHIGNITFSSVSLKNKFASIGICIGKKEYWNKGYGQETLAAAKRVGFNVLKLNRLEACVCIKNVASIKLFTKLKFKKEAKMRSRRKIGKHYEDEILFACLKK